MSSVHCVGFVFVVENESVFRLYNFNHKWPLEISFVVAYVSQKVTTFAKKNSLVFLKINFIPNYLFTYLFSYFFSSVLGTEIDL